MKRKLQNNEILVRALGTLACIRFDFSSYAADHARLEEFRRAWEGATVSAEELDTGSASSPGEINWTFPAPGGQQASIAELSTQVTLTAVAKRRGQLLMLHAAGLADCSGKVVAFIGPSGSGKTTLARALGQEYSYVSDETVGIGADGTVHAYRKPLSVIRPGVSNKKQLAPSALGLKELPATDLRLGRLILIRREGDLPGGPELEDLSLCEALPLIVPEASYLAELERPLQAVAGLLDLCGPVQRLGYVDAEDLLALTPQLFEPGHVAEPWAAVIPETDADGARNPFAPERFVPSSVIDAVEAEGQTAILDQNSVLHVLDGVGPVIWRSLVVGNDFGSVVKDVETAFGAPPEGLMEETVVAVMNTMAGAGVLTRVPDQRP